MQAKEKSSKCITDEMVVSSSPSCLKDMVRYAAQDLA